MFRKIRLLVLIVFCSLMINVTIVEASNSSSIVLEVTPNTVTIFPQENVDISLVIRNNSTMDILNLSISSFGSANVSTEMMNELPETISAGASWAVQIHLTGGSEEQVGGSLYFQLNYEMSDETDATFIPGVEYISVEVQDHVVLTVDEILDLKVSTPLTILSENMRGVIQVSVRNLATFPITIKSVIPEGTEYINFNPIKINQDVDLPSRTTKIFNFEVTLESPYQIQTEPLYFTTTIEWKEKEFTFVGNKVIEQNMPIGVFSEQSDYLKLLTLPSYLFLPGFLVVVIFNYCWMNFLPKTDLKLNKTTIEFWVLSITLSIPLIYIYRGISIWIGHPRQFPNVFGLVDILILWISSVLIGVLSWLGILTLRKWIKNNVPLPEDSPLSILHKLELNNSGFYLPQVQIADMRYVLFPPVNESSGKIWRIPFIEYEFTPITDQEYKDELRKITDRTEGVGSIDSPEGSRDLYRILKEGIRKKMIVVNWENGEQLALVDQADVDRKGRISILKERNPDEGM